MRPLRRSQLVALFTALALIVCTAVYRAHGLGDRAHQHEHCDPGVHLSGSAGSPAQVKVVGGPPFVARVAAAARTTLLPTRAPRGLSVARGPPGTSSPS